MTKKEPIPIQNLFYMLCYAWNILSIKDTIKIDSENFKDAHNLLARIFSYGVGKLIRQGFYRNYINTNEELTVLKGKILISDTLNQSSLIKKKICCEFDEFTSDNLFNQIIKYTLNSLVKNVEIDSAIKKDLKKQLIYFSHIKESVPSKNNLQKLKFHRNNFRYKLLISLAVLLYENTNSPNENAGKITFKDFYREEQMQKVYELFLLNFYALHLNKEIYRVHAPKISWNIDNDAFEQWGDIFDIEEKITDRRTDIVIENKKEKIQLIIDAKYYKEALIPSYQNSMKKTFRTSHINQVRGYILDSTFDGIKHGALIYPTVYDEQLEKGTVLAIKGAHIIAKTINLNQDWRRIEEDLLSFVRNIVK